MKTIQDKLKYLEEDCNFYNLTNRSTKDDGCFYSPQPNSPGCSIGRRIKDKRLCAALDVAEKYIEGDTGVLNTAIFSQLPADLKEYGQDFLITMQTFHDTSEYWTETGLSEEGERRKKYIEIYINECLI